VKIQSDIFIASSKKFKIQREYNIYAKNIPQKTKIGLLYTEKRKTLKKK
jgi:hypothetical protein